MRGTPVALSDSLASAFRKDALLAKASSPYAVGCRLDILRDEGIAHGEKLQCLGMNAEVNIQSRAWWPVVKHRAADDALQTKLIRRYYGMHA
jgi:hypothetical protein